MLALGTLVRYAPHHPGGVYDAEPWRIIGRTITEDDWRQPVVTYKVVRVSDAKRRWIDCCVRDEQLMPWREQYRQETDTLTQARQAYLAAKN